MSSRSPSPDALTYLRKAVGGIELLFAGSVDLTGYNRALPVERWVRSPAELLERLCTRASGQIQMALDLGLIDRDEALELQAVVEQQARQRRSGRQPD